MNTGKGQIEKTQTFLKKHLSVDPGSAGSGVALWDSEKYHEMQMPRDLFSLLSRQKTWENRVQDISEQLIVKIRPYEILTASIEFPEFMEGVRGYAAAREESVTKLAFMVGVISEKLWRLGTEVKLIRPHEWKGQLTKHAVEARIIRRLPEIKEKMNPRSHQWDAIGIGLYAKGHF